MKLNTHRIHVLKVHYSLRLKQLTEWILTIFELLIYRDRIILAQVPRHGNGGDLAITIAEKSLLKDVYPEKKMIEIPSEICTDAFVRLNDTLKLNRLIRQKDIIFLHGGGNLGSIYPSEGNYRRKYLLEHPNNRIIIMPQSVYYGTDKEAEEIKKKDIEAFKRARKLKLLCRDEMSFNTAKSIFTETTIALTPDVVTLLKEKLCEENDKERDGVLFVLRNDNEKVSDDATISEIKQWLDSNHVNHRSIDTVAKVLRMSKSDGEKHVQSILSAIKSSKLVVTDGSVK